MVLWKGKQNYRPLARLTKKKKREPNKTRNEREEITTNITEIHNICYKRILWAITCHQIRQPRRNGQVSRNTQSTKTELSTDNLNRLISLSKIASVIIIMIKKLSANKSIGLDGFNKEF